MAWRLGRPLFPGEIVLYSSGMVLPLKEWPLHEPQNARAYLGAQTTPSLDHLEHVKSRGPPTHTFSTVATLRQARPSGRLGCAGQYQSPHECHEAPYGQSLALDLECLFTVFSTLWLQYCAHLTSIPRANVRLYT